MKCFFFKRLAIYGVATVIVHVNVTEKMLNAVGLLYLPFILTELFPIQCDIRCHSVGITVEVTEISMRLWICRSTIVIGIFG